MEIFEIKADLSEDALVTTCAAIFGILTDKRKELYFEVDANHPTLCSFNGSIYSKDMKTLYMIAPMHEDKTYVMPPTVVEVKNKVAMNNIKNLMVSPNLTAIAGDSFWTSQSIDFRNTKLSICHGSASNLVSGAAKRIVLLPVGRIDTDHGTYYVTEHEIILDDMISKRLAAIVSPDKKYVIPDGVTHLNGTKISENIEEIHVSASVKSIDYSIFNQSHIRKMTVDKNNEVFFEYQGCLYERNTTGYTLLFASRDITILHILEQTTTISSFACKKLKLEEVSFPDSLTTIKAFGFSNCEAPKIDLSNTNCTIINPQAFSQLKTSEIFMTTKHSVIIMQNAFEYAQFDVMYADNVQSVYYDAFLKSKFKKLKFSFALNDMQDGVFQNATAEEVDLSETQLRTISRIMFQGSHIPIIKLPDSIDSIGMEAFEDSDVQEIVIPNEEKHFIRVAHDAFANSQIRVFDAPRVCYLAERAFYNCTQLRSFNIHEKCNVKSSAFQKCSKKIREQAKKFKK